MDILNLVTTTLRATNIPVAFQFYKGTASTYITFFVNEERGAMFADNEEINTRYEVKVNIWGKTTNIALQNQVKELMKLAGFTRITGLDLYESSTGFYQKQFRFLICE